MARHLRQLPGLCALLLAGACNGAAPAPKPAQTGPARGGSLTATIRTLPETFNRFVNNQAATDAVTRLTHASLTRLNRVTGDYEPWLAEKWVASSDGRVITFTLRDGVTFSDGVPFTSADVVFSFRVLYDPEVRSVLASGIKVQGKPLQISALAATFSLRRHCDFESLVILVPLLVLDVLLDRLLIHRAHRRTEVPSRPQVLAPVSLSYLRKLVLNPPG